MLVLCTSRKCSKFVCVTVHGAVALSLQILSEFFYEKGHGPSLEISWCEGDLFGGWLYAD